MIDYTPFWYTLKTSKESTYTLINKHRISSATIDKLRKNKPLTTTTINYAGFLTVQFKKSQDIFHQKTISPYRGALYMKTRNS